MKEHVETLISYGTISKRNLGIYLFVLWLLLTFITMPDDSGLLDVMLPSLSIFAVLCLFFLLRILIDWTNRKRLMPDVNSHSQVNAAIRYLDQLNRHA